MEIPCFYILEMTRNKSHVKLCNELSTLAATWYMGTYSSTGMPQEMATYMMSGVLFSPHWPTSRFLYRSSPKTTNREAKHNEFKIQRVNHGMVGCTLTFFDIFWPCVELSPLRTQTLFTSCWKTGARLHLYAVPLRIAPLPPNPRLDTTLCSIG